MSPRIDGDTAAELEHLLNGAGIPETSAIHRTLEFVLDDRSEPRHYEYRDPFPGARVFPESLYVDATASPVGGECSRVTMMAWFRIPRNYRVKVEGIYCLRDPASDGGRWHSAWWWYARGDQTVTVLRDS